MTVSNLPRQAPCGQGLAAPCMRWGGCFDVAELKGGEMPGKCAKLSSARSDSSDEGKAGCNRSLGLFHF
ncbi:hypothetical protein SCLCIDRAFT_1207484 [Scleroderma citrinum Foug A]|uniref:Uncharacterized protein n=1 Tax=Scleroderma citrinum Foug A TaxID=1036808 RepID=A0A0C3AYY2_9AGAM|nr:hypothetical protein SCLCIDRAFT_1207484 [Scleroderma citrinum Foug A]